MNPQKTKKLLLSNLMRMRSSKNIFTSACCWAMKQISYFQACWHDAMEHVLNPTPGASRQQKLPRVSSSSQHTPHYQGWNINGSSDLLALDKFTTCYEMVFHLFHCKLQFWLQNARKIEFLVKTWGKSMIPVAKWILIEILVYSIKLWLPQK